MSTIPEPPNIYVRPFVSDQVIELYWRPPVSDGGDPISSYILECSNIGFTQILPPSDNKIKISNLENGIYYNFSLKATNINGNSNIAEFRTVQPGFPPANPTGLDFTTSNFSDMPYVNFSFNNPVYTGNIDLTHNLVTLVPVNNSGNLFPNDYFKYYRSTYGFDNMREIKFEEINYNYNYKALVQSINDVNYSSYSNFIDTIVNPNLPTNGLKLWLDPFDLTTITLDDNNLVTVWNDKSKNKYQATNLGVFRSSAPTYDLSNACIRFNGGQFLNLSPNSIPSANRDYSMFFYTDTSNILIGSQYIFDSGNSLTNSDVASYFDFNSFEHDCGNNLYIGNLAISSNITNLYEIYNDNGNISLFINGIIASTGRSNLRLSDISSNSIIGTNKNLTGNLLGSVGEIIMYDRVLTIPERNTVRNYLQFKENESILKNWGNLVVWLDANNPNNFYDSLISKKISYNSNVTTFLDRSGANNNAIANDLTYPTRRTVFNNFNIMNFANSYIQISRAYYPLDSFIIVDLNSNTEINGIMGIGTSANNYNSLSFGRLQTNRWSIDSTNFSATSSSDETSSNLLLLEWNINNGNNYLNRNGSSLLSSNNTYTLPTNANIYIGNHNGFDFANKLKGGIGEVISFNKQLSTSDRYVMEGYLSWKYGLVSSLTNNHPYKDNPPYLFSRDLNTFTAKNPGNIILWYDASDTTNTIFNGNNLANIFDKSLRNNNPFTYSSNRPTRSNINGLTSLYFNSNSGNVSYFSGNLSLGYVGNVSVFIVGSMSNASPIDNPRLFELDYNNSILENGMIVREGANSNIAIHDVALEGINGNIKLSSYNDYDVPFVYSMVLNNSNVTSYINGNFIGTSPPGIANYSPNVKANIFLWFDSSDLTTMTISSNVVTQWRNKANISSNLTLQPYDIYVGPNISSTGLVFNNFNNNVKTAGQAGLSLNSNITLANTNKAFYFVYNNLRPTTGTLNDLLQLRSTFTDNLQYHIDIGVTSPATGPFVANGNINVYSNATSWSTANVFTILGVYFTPTNVSLRVNGVTFTGTTLTALNNNNTLYDILSIGGHIDSRNFTGTISEILVYDGLTINDIVSANKIEGYLGYKWNLLNYLTTSHQYYPGYNRWGIGASGLNNSTFQNGWTGKIGEVITYSHAIDNNFRQSVEGYLAHKWNLTNYLSSNHLYKFSKPYLSTYSLLNVRTNNIVTIGTSTSISAATGYPNPYGVYYWGARHQFFYTQAELNAAGIFAGDNITAIAFNCAGAITYPMAGYTIGLTNTSLTDPINSTTGSWLSTTQYWSNSSFNPVVGWNIHTFTSSFTYNGGGIIINNCYNNNAYTSGHTVYQTTTLSGATFSRWFRQDNTGTCTLTTVSGTSTTTRPNIRFYLA